MDDVTAITQVILKERQGRDRGWFEQEASCFHPRSRVHITWFDGPGDEFVELSRASYAEGIRPSHRLAPPVVHHKGDRAVAEVPAEISVIQDFGGVDAYIIAYTRLLYRVERLNGSWMISALDCIYERNTVVPVVHGSSPTIDPELLARFRRPFMYLGYHLHQAGRQIRDDLYGDDQPGPVNALYEAAFSWLGSHDGGPFPELAHVSSSSD
ncbi:nuclear transport factor 2 family protein [Amycolatopsis sp. CA-126428]|uniref:nuclear transport factor 2 family protein n=1 Tax=Amycolatopsis sp. CA-126428 TaxID=2073158 RepID=UPI001304D69B|nr:nuclear transport factor 2 family protein [Amycolatopsis sp. CA-126428]